MMSNTDMKNALFVDIFQQLDVGSLREASMDKINVMGIPISQDVASYAKHIKELGERIYNLIPENQRNDYLIRYRQLEDAGNTRRLKLDLANYLILHAMDVIGRRQASGHTILYRFADVGEYTVHDDVYNLGFKQFMTKGWCPKTYNYMRSKFKDFQYIRNHWEDVMDVRRVTYNLDSRLTDTTLGHYIDASYGVGTGISGWVEYSNYVDFISNMYSNYARDNRMMLIMKVPNSLDWSSLVPGSRTEYIEFQGDMRKTAEDYKEDIYRIRYKPGVIQYFCGGCYIPSHLGQNVSEIDLVGYGDIQCWMYETQDFSNIHASMLLELIRDTNVIV